MAQSGPKFWGEIPSFWSKLGKMGEKCTFPSLRIAKVTEIHPKLAKFGCFEAYGQRLSPWLKLGLNFGVESQHFEHFGQKWEKWVKNAHFCPSSPPKPQNSPQIPQFQPIFSQNRTFSSLISSNPVPLLFFGLKSAVFCSFQTSPLPPRCSWTPRRGYYGMAKG